MHISLLRRLFAVQFYRNPLFDLIVVTETQSQICIIFAILFACIYIIWAVYKLHGLMKVDFSKNINDNIYYMNKYNIHIKWDKIASRIYIPIFAILCILSYAESKVSVQIWVFMICLLLLVTLLTYWSWKGIYDNNIAAIRKSLEELKELEEE
ncbi:hypothetical protein FACS189420_8750 [Bacteroidia bacterium]|nr:hypothetical protein FACS189420_8750 [Bacteroidia bacterium]